jgi:hypothetical protein
MVRRILTVVMRCMRRRNLVPAAGVLVITILALLAPRGGPSIQTEQRPKSQLCTSVMSMVVGQDDDTDEDEVSTDEIEKYVSVYKAMQRNRTLTIDHAAAAQGLTVEQFRQLEDRVERDDAALQQAREELEAAAQGLPSPGEKPPPHP